MKVLLIVDKLHWAYHTISLAIHKYKQPGLLLDILPVKGGIKNIKNSHKRYDRFFVMGWQNYDAVDFLPREKTLVGIHSYHSWDDRKTTPELDATPPQWLIEKLSGFLKVNAVSRRLTDLFIANGLKGVTYTPNGVDTDIFKPRSTPTLEGGTERLRVGYSGSKSHDWRKGVSEFIRPAVNKSAVAELRLAMLGTDTYAPLEQMPRFYDNIDCYVCASSSEGMSLSVLEAGACGKPIIGTKISGNEEIIRDGKTGYLVKRDVDEIASRLIELYERRHLLVDMSNAVAKDIKENWSWERRSKAWLDFIES